MSRLLISCLLSGFLIGCGGGGGGGGSSSEPATLAGTAAKGIIRSGTVTVEELRSNGAVLRTVGTTTTDDNGDYSIQLSDDYAGGPLRVRITPTSATRMVCDVQPTCGAVAFGDPVTLPDDFELSAILPEAADDSAIAANVTPFTHMAAESAITAAETNGNLNAAAVNSANSSVNNLLGGIDILNTKPKNLASTDDATPTEEAYALLAAAVGEVAYDGDGDLAAAIDALANSWEDTDEDGLPQIAATTATEGKISLNTLVQNAENQRTANSLADRAGVLSSLQLAVTNATESGSVEGTPSSNTGDSNVTKAKALMLNVRTMYSQMSDLEEPAIDFQENFPHMGEVLTMIDGTLRTSLTQSIEIMSNTLTTGLSSPNGPAGTYPYNEGTGTVGNVVITVASSKITVALDGTVDGQDSDMTMSLPNPQSSFKTAALSLTGTISNTVAAKKLVISEGSLSITLNTTFDANQIGSEDDLAAIYPQSGSLTFKFEMGEIFTAPATGIYFTGEAKITIANSGTTGDDLYPKDIKLSGDFSDGDNDGEVVITATVSNPTSTSPSGTLSIAATLTLADQTPVTATLAMSGTGNGALSSGDLSQDMLASGSASLRLSHDGNTLTIAIGDSNVDDEGNVESVVVTATDGTSTLSITVTPGADTPDEGTVTVGTTQVATFTTTSSGLTKVSYIDGTFEIL